MTTGSVSDGSLIPGLPGGRYGRTFSRSWTGGDWSNPNANWSPPNIREMYLTPEHLGLVGYVSPLGDQALRDYQGRILVRHEERVPMKGARLTREKKAEWHPYTTERVSNTAGTYIERRISDGNVAGGPYGFEVTQDSQWVELPNFISSNDILSIESDLFSQMRGSDFNLSVFLAEGNQTLNMIAGNAIKLAKSIHHLRKGDVTGAMRSLVQGTDRRPLRAPPASWDHVRDLSVKNLSQHWLELQYGWLPLLSDCAAGAEALAHRLTPPFRKTIVASKQRSAVTQFTTGVFSIERRQSDLLRIEFVASENPSTIALLGLNDPLTVAWELMPYSFVIDWFLPIGDYLQARQAASSLKGAFRQTRMRRVDTTASMRGTGNGVVRGEWFDPYAYPSRRSNILLVRDAEANTLRPPLPSFKTLDKALSWKHCANALSLLAGAKPPIL